MLTFNANPAGSRLLERVSAPASEPVTVSEAKLYLRLDTNAEDALLAEQIAAARMTAEQWMRRSLITQSWKLGYDHGIPACVGLPMGPVSAVVSVVCVQQGGATTALAAESFWLNAARDAVHLAAPVFAFRVEITYVAGFGAAAAVPMPIKQGILAHVAHLYDNRGDLALPEAAAQLYLPYRDVRL